MSKPVSALSVKVIIHDRLGKVLLLQRSNTCKNNVGKWEFSGGKVDPGENFAQALIREVREETGLTIELTGSFGTCEAKRAKPAVVYLVMEAKAKGTKVRRSSEHQSHKWVAPADFEDIAFVPQFRRIARLYAQDAAILPRESVIKAGKRLSKDLFEGWEVTPETLLKHLSEFQRTQSLRTKLAEWMEQYLKRGVRQVFPLADISARSKDAVSFVGKLIKKNKYKDPLRDITDLVGARINLHLQEEVATVCRWIEENFEIDRANSLDTLELLGAERFGYRAVHYVVRVRHRKPAGVPRRFVGLKIEIQVRTIAQHVWADIGHDRVYKADCDIPAYWKREANRVAALLEAVDGAFARLVQGMTLYKNHIKQSADEEAARRHILLWDAVRKAITGDPRPAQRVALYAKEVQDWRRVCQVVDAYAGKPNASLLCTKGYALCKMAASSRATSWQRGIRLLEKSCEMDPGFIDPHLHLGELLAPIRIAKALTHNERAFVLNPAHPSAVAGYIRCKVLREKSVAFIPLLKPEIESAIERSKELAAAGADLPQALYRVGGLFLLLGPTHDYQSLDLFAKAVHQTVLGPAPLLQALRDISQLAKLMPDRPDVECSRRFLAAALRAKFPAHPWPTDVRKPAARSLRPRNKKELVIIVAGGCDAHHEATMRSYAKLLTSAFRDFRGTIISGGTKEGISGLVGDLADKSGGRIRTIGYLPRWPIRDGTATLDYRYRQHGEIRKTDEPSYERFSSRQPIQNWLDLLAAGVHPNQVRLLGINGGNIAGLEYRLAVALGAKVGVIEGSGREAERVLNDWPAQITDTDAIQQHAGENNSKGYHAALPGQLIPLPKDPATISPDISSVCS